MTIFGKIKPHAAPSTPHADEILPIEAVDRFASRWMASLSYATTVFSPVGVWPLLAILADVARPDVRRELEDALCLSPDPGAESCPIRTGTTLTNKALAMLQVLDTSASLTSALGLWVSAHLDLREEWVISLPTASVQLLAGDAQKDSAALTALAIDKTRGMIRNLNVQVGTDTLLILASAATMSTCWRDRFTRNGQGRLSRTTRDARIIRSSKDITTVCILGGRDECPSPTVVGQEEDDGAHDVCLVLGRPGVPAGQVLKHGLNAIRGAARPLMHKSARAKKELGPGLCAFSKRERGAKSDEDPCVTITVLSFDVQARTQIGGEVFGLRRAVEGADNFPGIAFNAPLPFSAGIQIARAGFGEAGFEAAANRYRYSR